MIPFIRREARLLTNIRAFIPRSFGHIAGPLEACRYSRFLSTFDMGFVAPSMPQNELTSVRGGANPVASTDARVWGSLRRWRAQPRECSVRMMAWNTLAGAERLTSSLLKAWPPALPFSGSLSSTLLTGRDQLGLWTQRLGDEVGEEEMGPRERDGVWLSSVKRKRVTKMRKHKWRKRRKLSRQSSDRK